MTDHEWETKKNENAAASFQDAIALIRADVEAQRQPGETTEDTMRRLGMLKGYFARSTTYRLPKPPSVNSCYRNVTDMQIITDDNMACVVRLVAEIGPEFTLKIEDAE